MIQKISGQYINSQNARIGKNLLCIFFYFLKPGFVPGHLKISPTHVIIMNACTKSYYIPDACFFNDPFSKSCHFYTETFIHLIVKLASHVP